MKMIAINKHSSKLKNWSVEMPNAPYLKRWATLKIHNPKYIFPHKIKLHLILYTKNNIFGQYLSKLLMSKCKLLGNR